MKWKKLHFDAIQGLLYLLEGYTDSLHATTIQERWILLELNHLVQRLWAKREKMKWENKTRADLRIPERECYAFALMMQTRTLDLTNYIDNLLLKMLTDIHQTYNC